MYRQPNAAAHCNTVHVCDVGFGICSDEMIELVFEFEVGLARSLAFGARGILFDKSCDVTAGAERFRASTTDYYYTG